MTRASLGASPGGNWLVERTGKVRTGFQFVEPPVTTKEDIKGDAYITKTTRMPLETHLRILALKV